MPWTPGEVDGFRKGLSRKQKKKWVAIANGALASCMEGGGSDKECSGRAVRIANSKFQEFNPVINGEISDRIRRTFRFAEDSKMPKQIRFDDVMDCTECDEEKKEKMKAMLKTCVDEGGDMVECKKKVMDKMNGQKDMTVMDMDCPECDEKMKAEMNRIMKECMADGKDESECKEMAMDRMREMKKNENRDDMSLKFADIQRMEIFRCGIHNGDKFSEQDLYEIAENFKALKNIVRPKLKITHHGDNDEQISLAGLASYGNVEEVYLAYDGNGEQRLFAKISNVPEEVISWINEGRFAERSIEIYPEFRIGSDKDKPVYKNVLKAIALLGHEMPAVAGMAPISLAEYHENQKTICFKEFCISTEQWIALCNEVRIFRSGLEFNIGGHAMKPEEVEQELKKLQAAVDQQKKDYELKLDSEKKEKEGWKANAEQREAELKKFQDLTDKAKKEAEDARAKVKAQEIKTFVEGLKRDGKIIPAQEECVTKLMESMTSEQKVATFKERDGSATDHTQASLFKMFLGSIRKTVSYSEDSYGTHFGNSDTPDNGGEAQKFVDVRTKSGGTVRYPVSGAEIAEKAEKYMEEQRVKGIVVSYGDALIAVSPRRT